MKPARTKILKSLKEIVHLPAENSQGRKKTELAGRYHLTTSEEKYCLNFYLYARDDENEENTGLYKIEIAAEADVQQEDFIWDNPEIGVFVGG